MTVIKLSNISKSYKLFDTPLEKAVYGLGFERFGPLLPSVRRHIPEKLALKHVSLELKQGDRLGVIGRNGSGKSTLLKIITGVIEPSSGERYVADRVEALFDTTMGFNAELTGLENIENGLSIRLGKQLQRLEEARRDVINFVELGNYLYQPVKNYSKGMYARLGFAVATALCPDIVVVDEVLGAGDAYFSAKAARRVRSMFNGHTTLVLVSHSTKQVLEFCERSIWIENGEIVMEGESLRVIKAYDEFIERLRHKSLTTFSGKSVLDDEEFRTEVLQKTLYAFGASANDASVESAPAASVDIPPPAGGAAIESNVLSDTGISRWPHLKEGIMVRSVRLIDQAGQPVRVVETGQEFSIQIDYETTSDQTKHCRFVVLFFNTHGHWLCRQVSPPEAIAPHPKSTRRKTMTFPANQFGAGNIIFTVALFETDGAIRAEDNYETLSRSFEFKVINPNKDDRSFFMHPCQWGASETLDDVAQPCVATV